MYKASLAHRGEQVSFQPIDQAVLSFPLSLCMFSPPFQLPFVQHSRPRGTTSHDVFLSNTLLSSPSRHRRLPKSRSLTQRYSVKWIEVSLRYRLIQAFWGFTRQHHHSKILGQVISIMPIMLVLIRCALVMAYSSIASIEEMPQ